jgi:methionyl aminopeptidase
MFVFQIIPIAILLSGWGGAILVPRSLSRRSSHARSSSFHTSYYDHDSSLLVIMKMREESSAKKPRTSSNSGRSTAGGRGFAESLPKLPTKSFSYSGTIRPGRQSPQRIVTDPNIMLPDYATDGKPKKHSQSPLPWMIEVKSPKEIEWMRAAGRCAREVLDIAGRAVQPGVTTDEIDALVHEETLKVSLQFTIF